MSGYDMVVQGGQVLVGQEFIDANIGVRDGTVAAISTDRLDGAEVLDATGLVVLPGLVDEHFHSWWKYGFDDHETATRAALKGGVTTVLEMPMDNPPTLTVSALRDKESAVNGQYYVDHAPLGGYVSGQPEEFEALAEEGVAGYKLFTGDTAPPDMYPGSDNGEILEVLRLARKLGLPVLIHSEDGDIMKAEMRRLQAEGAEGPKAWEEARPWFSEVAAVENVALLAEVTGARVVVCHVPTPRSVDAVAAARTRGADIWVESCTHNLCLSLEDFADEETRFKWNPPTRKRVLVDELWTQLSRGWIHTIGSDHTPLTKVTGESIWTQNPGSGNVLEIMLPVLATEALQRGVPFGTVVDMVTSTPARLFNLYPRKGAIAVGSDADLALMSLTRTKVIRSADLEWLDPSQRWSAYEGRTVSVVPVYTVLGGKIACAEGEIVGKPGWGRRIKTLAWERTHAIK